MTKLSDTKLVILSAAAQCEDRNVLSLPGLLRGGAAARVVGALLKRGLIAETTTDSQTKADVALILAGETDLWNPFLFPYPFAHDSFGIGTVPTQTGFEFALRKLRTPSSLRAIGQRTHGLRLSVFAAPFPKKAIGTWGEVLAELKLRLLEWRGKN